MHLRAWGICASLIGLGWSFPALADCSKDTDCKGERICESGRCVNPGGAAAAPQAPAPAPVPEAPQAPQPPRAPPLQAPQGPPSYEPYMPPEMGSYGPPPPPPPYWGYPPPPPPAPPAIPAHRLAARAGLSGGLQESDDQFGNSTAALGFGIEGGVGVYAGNAWGVMVAGSYDPLYPSAVLVDGEVFLSNPWLWGSFGLGWGDFRLPVGSAREGGFAVTTSLYFKFEPHWGLGFEFGNISRSHTWGNDNYARLQLAVAWLY